SERGLRDLAGAITLGSVGAGAQALAPRPADRLPGPARGPGCAHDDRSDRLGATRGPRATSRGRGARAPGGADARACWLGSGADEPLPARALRGPVPARRHRARDDPGAAAARLR